MLEIESLLYDKGLSLIAGVDEAGRGPLAGPVCAAAVILPKGLVLDGINDSKKLSAKKREKLYDEIISAAIAYSVEFVGSDIIDEINILQATHIAMNNALKNLSVKPDFAIIDGNDKLPMCVDCEYIIKGDAKSQTIAAASILAKVSRDRLMCEIAPQYPKYNFEKHKGYATKQHMEAIREHGILDIHRKTFITDKVLGKK